MKIVLSFILLGLLGLPAMADTGIGYFPVDHENPLEKAHLAYLDKDFQKMTHEMRLAIEARPEDSLVRENVFGLLAKAYELRGAEGIPVDWHLPEEIKRMRICVRRFLKDVPEYRLKVQGHTAQPQLIKQLKITRYPDQVILDKEAGIGEWEEEKATAQSSPYYQLQSPKTRQPVTAGLYLLKLELTNGKQTQGWFFITPELTATSSPVVYSPADGQSFQTANPAFRWDDYHSDQYRPNEHRSLWIAVSRAEPPKYDWDLRWSLSQDSPIMTEISAGIGAGGMGDAELSPGRYMFSVNYVEQRNFGDLVLSRESTTIRPFYVHAQ